MSNNSAEIIKLIETSISTHERVFPASVALCICSGVAILSNGLVIYAIVSVKRMRNRPYYCITANLSVADLLVGLSYMYVSIMRIIVKHSDAGLLRSKLSCLFDVMFMTFAITSSTMFNFVVALDRLLAVSFPIKYRQVRKVLYTLIMTGFVWLYTLIDMLFVPISTTNLQDTIPMCTNVGVYQNAYNAWVTWSRIVWSTIGALIGIAAIFLVRHKLLKNDQCRNLREVSQTTGTIFIVVTLTFLNQILTRIGFLSIASLPPAERSKYGSFFRTPQVMNAAINLFIYIWRSNEFKRALFPKFQIADDSSISRTRQNDASRRPTTPMQ